MNILILEDEIPAYHKLVDMIHTRMPNANVLGWARSIAEANLLLKKGETLDLIFSDIELLDGHSFQVFETHKTACPIIFCTAFDQFLLKAFQGNGIAYLLKPYSIEDFNEAIEKYKTLFTKEKKNGISSAVMEELRTVLHQDRHAYKSRFTVKKRDGIKLLDTADIVYFEANGDFCMAIDHKGAKHALSFTLGDVARKLNPKQFFRLNRSQIVHIAFIEKVEAYSKNKLSVQLKTKSNNLMTSGSRTAEFRAWLEG